MADDDRLIIEVFDADGVCIDRSVGPSQQELKAAHDAGECGALCGYCYTDACYELEHLLDVREQFHNGPWNAYCVKCGVEPNA